MAMIAEQAGGKASDGKRPILDLSASGIHERTPIFIGSSKMVEKVEGFIEAEG